jgi:hypothetical protein
MLQQTGNIILSSLFLKVGNAIQNALQTALNFNGLTVQDILVEAEAEFFMVEYLQVFLEELGVRL